MFHSCIINRIGIILALAILTTMVSSVQALQLAQQPTCEGRPATIVGTSGNDYIVAKMSYQVIVGLGGNDVIKAGHTDVICGNEGDDNITGSTGWDTIYGGQGNDIINGGDGNDIIYGNKGNDTINGGGNNDTIYGNEDNDKLNGDSCIISSTGTTCTTGMDKIYGGQGDDSLNGGDRYIDVDVTLNFYNKLNGGIGFDYCTRGEKTNCE